MSEKARGRSRSSADDENDRQILRTKLREAREYLGLSQDEVAKCLEIPRTALSHIESGQRRVDALELKKLAKLYKRPVAFFTGDAPADGSLTDAGFPRRDSPGTRRGLASAEPQTAVSPDWKSGAETGSAERVLEILTDRLHGMSPQLQQAARYIVDHPMEVGVNSMRKLAEMSGVTPNTLTRLSRQLGYETYQDFKNLFREAVRQQTRAIPDRARWLQSIGSGSAHALVIGQMADALLQSLEQGLAGLDPAELERIARRIIEARKVYVVGVRGAYSLAHSFHYVARMALPEIRLVPRHVSPPVDDLVTIVKGDVLVAITLAPYALETSEAVRFAKRQGATVIAVTDSRASPIVRHAEDTLIAPSGTPHFFNSHVGASAVLEVLLALLVVSGDESLLTSIRRIDTLRHEFHAYLDALDDEQK